MSKTQPDRPESKRSILDRYIEEHHDYLQAFSARLLSAKLVKGHSAGTLVNEAFMRLSNSANLVINDGVHFKMLAKAAVRQVCTDLFRRDNADKRGGAARTVSADDTYFGSIQAKYNTATDSMLMMLAIEDFSKVDALHGEIAASFVLEGKSQTQIQSDLSVSRAKVQAALRLFTRFLGH